MSSEYGVMTRYARTICTGRLRSDFDTVHPPWPLTRTHVSCSDEEGTEKVHFQGALLQKFHALLQEEVLAVWDGKMAILYTWLDPQEFDFLRSTAGAVMLEAWLAR